MVAWQEGMARHAMANASASAMVDAREVAAWLTWLVR